MRKIILPLLLLPALSVFGQTENISDWQRTHPQVIFIEASELQNFEEQQIKQLSDNVIIYNETITQADIDAYVFQQKAASGEIQIMDTKDDAEMLFVKSWLARNRDVKLVRRSYFDQLDEHHKEVYLQANSLILAGEQITAKDIRSYEEEH